MDLRFLMKTCSKMLEIFTLISADKLEIRRKLKLHYPTRTYISKNTVCFCSKPKKQSAAVIFVSSTYRKRRSEILSYEGFLTK